MPAPLWPLRRPCHRNGCSRSLQHGTRALRGEALPREAVGEVTSSWTPPVASRIP